jgi:hypothetical protein
LDLSRVFAPRAILAFGSAFGFALGSAFGFALGSAFGFALGSAFGFAFGLEGSTITPRAKLPMSFRSAELPDSMARG